MKKASELGLETIQLEDQVLLVESIKGFCGTWILQDNKQFPSEVIMAEHDKDFGGRDKDIIASTKPLEGLPLLVIEDDVDEIVESHFNIKHPSDETIWKKALWKDGFKTAKEIYKFTEEDLRKAIKMSKVTQKYKYGEGRVFVNSDESIIQSLTKKELWVDAYWDCCGRCIDGEDKCTATWELNINNNQVKAVWRTTK